MKYYVIISLISIILSCTEKQEKFVPEKFGIENIEVKISNGIRDIIQYKNGYIFRTDDFKDSGFVVGFLDKNFKIDKDLSKLLGGEQRYYSAIWTSGDTLYAVEGSWPNYSTKYWKKDHWEIIKSFHVTKQSYGSSELNYPIYEDKEFNIRACCRGEFGGAIFFKDKKTNKTYSCQATCLNGIQKLNGSFYVTSSIPHGSGFARVIRIDDPRKLYEIKNTSQLLDCGWYDIYPDNPREDVKHPQGYDKGYEVLIDTLDINIIGAFTYKNHIYHIYSDDRNTYIGYIKDKKTVAIDTIVKKVAWHGEVRDLKNNSNIFPIRSRYLMGMIIIEGKKIKLIEFK